MKERVDHSWIGPSPTVICFYFPFFPCRVDIAPGRVPCSWSSMKPRDRHHHAEIGTLIAYYVMLHSGAVIGYTRYVPLCSRVPQLKSLGLRQEQVPAFQLFDHDLPSRCSRSLPSSVGTRLFMTAAQRVSRVSFSLRGALRMSAGNKWWLITCGISPWATAPGPRARLFPIISPRHLLFVTTHCA